MSINQERLQEMIELIYHMKEEMEVHHDSTFLQAHAIAESLQEELEDLLEDMS